MSETDNNTQEQKPKTSQLRNLLLGFTGISVICFISLFFTAAYTARILFALSVILAAALGVVSIFKIKLSGGKRKDMALPIIGGIIIPVFLVGIVLASIIIGEAMDSVTAVVRLSICKK